ncbi:MAG: hypothetical protein GC190_20950 [Alphaproteobacteria bacterium]|nr:hypothetical protein [Alphaproteobacteria bacterium]
MGLKLWQVAGGVATFAYFGVATAFAAAQDPVITGDRWVAYGIIGGLILLIVVFVAISIGVARRDAAYERGHKHHNVLPGLPVLGEEEDGEDD